MSTMLADATQSEAGNPPESPSPDTPSSSSALKPAPRPSRKSAQSVRHFLCGLCMGGADVVPGVSGGTVALVLGIYERLLNAISAFDTTLWRLLRQRQWKSAFAHVDGGFLTALGMGIGCGVLALARLMHYLLAEHRTPTLAVFLGLLIGSIYLVVRQIYDAYREDSSPPWLLVLTSVVGAFTAYWVVTQTGAAVGAGLGYYFVCGAIAICAMILPGISGAYLLLIFGLYYQVTGTIKNLPSLNVSSDELVQLGVFTLGCAFGLAAFSKLLKFLLEKHHSLTLAALCGLMIGALYRIWPFQVDTTPQLDESHKIYDPIWPETWQSEHWFCMALALIAAISIPAVEWLAQSKRLHREPAC